MGKYFTTSFKPDIIDGDVSKVIASNKTDKAFSGGDILFDWQAIDIPKGACALVDACLYAIGEDGGDQTAADIILVFAKSVNGVAPGTLGEENAAVTACFEKSSHIIGAAKLEGSSDGIGSIGLGHGRLWYGNTSGNNGNIAQCVLEGEPDSGVNVGYDKIYVAGICSTANIDFSTGVTSGAVSADSATDITVSAVDVRTAFEPGDIVYVHDQDTALGTVSSVPDATSLILTANNAVAIENTDELVNATPMRVTLKFSR